jgi:cyclophilin family peptidyl-prolyl cis-trans isomerase
VNVSNRFALAALAAALLALAACEAKEKSPPPAVGAGDAVSGDPVKLAVTAEKTKVALGDEIVFDVALTNTGKTPAQVGIPRIDRRSLMFRVRRPGGEIAKIERLHGRFGQSGRQFVLVPEAGDTTTVAPGDTFRHEVTTVALEVGRTTYTPVYTRQGAPEAQVAAPVEVDVEPAEAGRTHLGVQIDTSHGKFVARFRPDIAFNTVESFASLTRRGYFTGVKFHRIIRGFMAQGGDPTGTGGGGPGYSLPHEGNTKLLHRRGVMSMARSAPPDSAGSQFFVMFAPNGSLDPAPGRVGGEGYTTFAEMVEGDDTLKALEAVPVGPNPGMQGEVSVPKEPVLIQRAVLVQVP